LYGKRLRSIRKARGLTQEQFAELLDISIDFLSLIERGLNAPSFESIESFSMTLGIPVREFFDFGSDPLPKPQTGAKMRRS
jgi:transcriptional regulator with XRE-family HTH domain